MPRAMDAPCEAWNPRTPSPMFGAAPPCRESRQGPFMVDDDATAELGDHVAEQGDDESYSHDVGEERRAERRPGLARRAIVSHRTDGWVARFPSCRMDCGHGHRVETASGGWSRVTPEGRVVSGVGPKCAHIAKAGGRR